jgi:hypothetical protein
MVVACTRAAMGDVSEGDRDIKQSHLDLTLTLTLTLALTPTLTLILNIYPNSLA